jgi:hypothetical protein
MQNELTQAIQALKIDVPVLNWTIQNGKITLLLYGGVVRVWEIGDPLEQAEKPPTQANHKKRTRGSGG